MARKLSRHQVPGEDVEIPATPAEGQKVAEILRTRASWRKIVLMECGIIRHAPFDDAARPIWNIIEMQHWYSSLFPPAAWYRLSFAQGNVPRVDPNTGEPWAFATLNGHEAIECLEEYMDGNASDDQVLIANKFFRHADYQAEGEQIGRFDMNRVELTERQHYELAVRVSVADRLNHLRLLKRDSLQTLDLYLANYTGLCRSWGSEWPLHVDHRKIAVELIYDVLGHPFKSYQIDPAWRTVDTIAIASAMYKMRDFSQAPILADALEEAGCDNSFALSHCRGRCNLHVRGCWVVDQILGKE